LLSVPLNIEVLTALDGGPRPLVDVRRAIGSPPPTTFRGHLRRLTELRIVERARRNGFPGNLDLALGPAGRELMPVVQALSTWLDAAPEGPIEPGSVAARSSIKALVEGWSNSIVRAIAARPLSLTELDRIISTLSYPSLERRLEAMRQTGQIVPCQGPGRGTPYTVTEWLRRAVMPLGAAARWERTHLPDVSRPIGRLDIEAAFLLAVPMLSLPRHLSGVCRLAVDLPGAEGCDFVGVGLKICAGRVVLISSELTGSVDGVATGSAAAWLRAVAEPDPGQLDIGGDSDLVFSVVESLNAAFLDRPIAGSNRSDTPVPVA